jgi:HSP20 family protein
MESAAGWGRGAAQPVEIRPTAPVARMLLRAVVTSVGEHQGGLPSPFSGARRVLVASEVAMGNPRAPSERADRTTVAEENVMSNVVVRKTQGPQVQPQTEREPFHWIHWDPFRQMAPFLTGEDQSACFAPDFEIKETTEGFVFMADVPGVQEKDLEITMTGNRLTISGRREARKEENNEIFYARECTYGAFTRAFTLPDGTDGSNKIRAELDRGVLTLFLPKRPEQQPMRIEVKTADKPKA